MFFLSLPYKQPVEAVLEAAKGAQCILSAAAHDSGQGSSITAPSIVPQAVATGKLALVG